MLGLLGMVQRPRYRVQALSKVSLISIMSTNTVFKADKLISEAIDTCLQIAERCYLIQLSVVLFHALVIEDKFLFISLKSNS